MQMEYTIPSLCDLVTHFTSLSHLTTIHRLFIAMSCFRHTHFLFINFPSPKTCVQTHHFITSIPVLSTAILIISSVLTRSHLQRQPHESPYKWDRTGGTQPLDRSRGVPLGRCRQLYRWRYEEISSRLVDNEGQDNSHCQFPN